MLIYGLSEAVQIALITGLTTVAGGAIVGAPAIIAARRRAEAAQGAAEGAEAAAGAAQDAAEGARDAIGTPNGEGSVVEMNERILRELGGLRADVHDCRSDVTALAGRVGRVEASVQRLGGRTR